MILSRIKELQLIAEGIQSPTLGVMLHSLVESLTPVGIDLLLPTHPAYTTAPTRLSQLLTISSARWFAHATPLPADFESSDMVESIQTSLQASIACLLIYRSVHHAETIITRLIHSQIHPPTPVIATIVQSSLDSMNVRAVPADGEVYSIISGFLNFITSKSKSPRDRNQVAQALLALHRNGVDAQTNLAPQIAAHISTLPCHHFFRLNLQSWILQLVSSTCEVTTRNSLVETCIDLGLHHAVRQFSKDNSDPDQFLQGLEAFGMLS